MSNTAKYALIGGGVLVVILLLRNSSSGILPGSGVVPVGYNSTASTVSAIGSASGGILSALKGFFSPAPLTSGQPTNSNDTFASGSALPVGAAPDLATLDM